MMYGDADPDAYRQTLVSGKYRCYQMITIIVTVPKKDGTHKIFMEFLKSQFIKNRLWHLKKEKYEKEKYLA